MPYKPTGAEHGGGPVGMKAEPACAATDGGHLGPPGAGGRIGESVVLLTP